MNLLADIFARKRRELAVRPPQAARVRPQARDFAAALLQRRPGVVVNVIAEVKRKSPSGGNFPHQDLVQVARGYEAGGASAISARLAAAVTVKPEETAWASAPDVARSV